MLRVHLAPKACNFDQSLVHRNHGVVISELDHVWTAEMADSESTGGTPTILEINCIYYLT